MNENQKTSGVSPLKEIVEILAAGIIRLKRKGKSIATGVALGKSGSKRF
jgi:hypothetical protein